MDQAVRFREILRKLAMIDETIRGESRAGAGHADRPITVPWRRTSAWRV